MRDLEPSPIPNSNAEVGAKASPSPSLDAAGNPVDGCSVCEGLRAKGITTHPHYALHAQQRWPFNDPAAMASIRRGLDDAAAGRVTYLGSFAEHAQESESPQGSPGGLPEGVQSLDRIFDLPGWSHISERDIAAWKNLRGGEVESLRAEVRRLSEAYLGCDAENQRLSVSLAAARARIVELENQSKEAP